MNCQHNRYRSSQYMQLGKAFKDPNICWYGLRVQKCADCGEDLSKYRIVPVMTAEEYIKKAGIDYGQTKRRKRYGRR